MIVKHQLKAPLSKIIQAEYNVLIETISQVPVHYYAQKLIDGTGGKVSITDIVAYQIGWGTLLIGWYEAGLQNKRPEMPGEGFTKWDYVGLAKLFYTKYQYNNLDEQIQKFDSTVKQIIYIAEHEYQTNNLDKIGVWSWCNLSSGKQWPLSKWINDKYGITL